MQHVGYHLQQHAVSDSLPDHQRDEFARSAYNRYYYACFLLLRCGLTQMNQKWKNINHTDCALVFEKTIQNRFANGRYSAQDLSDKDLIEIIDTAIDAANKIAQIIRRAKSVREVADYQPDTPVDFIDNVSFSLHGISVTEAQDWLASIKVLLGNVLVAWRKIDA